MAEAHDLDDAQCFGTWEDLMAAGQLGDAAIVTTQDQMHVEPAVAAMRAGYDVLLEKPMAHTLEGCVQLVQESERTGRVLQICHVLRYAPFWRQLHEILDSGVLGDIITVEHRENVAYWHMAHSFVRGNWRNKALSSPMILAKCCHDLDVLVWNLNSPVKRLSSVGSLIHYRPESVGPEIPGRCVDNCPIEPAVPVLGHRHLPGLSAHISRAGAGIWQPRVSTPAPPTSGRSTSFRPISRLPGACAPSRKAHTAAASTAATTTWWTTRVSCWNWRTAPRST